MKVKTGFLTQKNGWWYLVSMLDGKKKWTALHTRDEDKAQTLAVERAPAGSARTDETARLMAVVAEGERARRRLAALRDGEMAAALTWRDLFERWLAAPHVRAGKQRDITSNAGTLKKYGCQLAVFEAWAVAQGIASPCALTGAQAQRYASGRMKTTVISGRDVALFSRVWRDLRLGDVWGSVKADAPTRSATGYRRLTVDEVRALVAKARAGKRRVRHPGGWFEPGGYDALPDVADLVTLAYHTGLRERDCVTLTAGNVDGAFLRVVPAKTSRRKVKPLLIPLQPEAREVVGRLAASAGADGRLFPRLFAASLSKSLRLTWERAGVRSNSFGKASFHSLRATFISMMDEAGVAAHVTDCITGHAPQGMHGRYTQPSRGALMEAVTLAIVPLGVTQGRA